MKHLVISFFLSMFIVSSALADWVEDFGTTLNNDGIEVAVIKAMEIGKTPTEIVTMTTGIAGLNPQQVLKALYCAGAAGDDIKSAADIAGLSEMMLLAAFDKAVAECGDKVADSQAYTPVGQQISFVGLPQPTPGGGRTASPSSFVN